MTPCCLFWPIPSSPPQAHVMFVLPKDYSCTDHPDVFNPPTEEAFAAACTDPSPAPSSGSIPHSEPTSSSVPFSQSTSSSSTPAPTQSSSSNVLQSSVSSLPHPTSSTSSSVPQSASSTISAAGTHGVSMLAMLCAVVMVVFVLWGQLSLVLPIHHLNRHHKNTRPRSFLKGFLRFTNMHMSCPMHTMIYYNMCPFLWTQNEQSFDDVKESKPNNKCACSVFVFWEPLFVTLAHHRSSFTIIITKWPHDKLNVHHITFHLLII